MKIGVIQTGAVREALTARFGEYPRMFETLVGEAAPDFSFETHPVHDETPPPDPEACDGWLVTGSRHGVYDDLPWIAPTEDFLRAARAAGRPIVGVCFGHQIVAQAFGGRAEKHEGGWRLGVHDFDFTDGPAWAQAAAGRRRLHSLHQDQVTAIPDDATLWAASPGCDYAGLIYGDPDRPDAISVQPHPEFAPDFAGALFEWMRDNGSTPEEIAEAGRRQVGAPVDNAAFGRVFADYFRAAGR